MKKLFLICFFSVFLVSQLEAQWCGCPCLRDRYYNPGWVDDDSRFYGYIDINEYPFTLPVNHYFNPRPCPVRRNYSYNYRIIEQPRVSPPVACPRCNGYHN
ncbi:MAG: hypothetical protein JJU12_00375 [Chlamydiales bacterium]|nr:hypothetical protein [Chlamydiales bacterium]